MRPSIAKASVRAVKPSHYAMHGSTKKFPKSAYSFWKQIEGCSGITNGVVVCLDGKLIGFFRFRVHNPTNTNNTHLRGLGTWVDKAYRCLGLGYLMWSFALRRHHVSNVYVSTISRSGTRLVKSLKADFPKIDFTHEVDHR